MASTVDTIEAGDSDSDSYDSESDTESDSESEATTRGYAWAAGEEDSSDSDASGSFGGRTTPGVSAGASAVPAGASSMSITDNVGFVAPAVGDATVMTDATGAAAAAATVTAPAPATAPPAGVAGDNDDGNDEDGGKEEEDEDGDPVVGDEDRDIFTPSSDSGGGWANSTSESDSDSSSDDDVVQSNDRSALDLRSRGPLLTSNTDGGAAPGAAGDVDNGEDTSGGSDSETEVVHTWANGESSTSGSESDDDAVRSGDNYASGPIRAAHQTSATVAISAANAANLASKIADDASIKAALDKASGLPPPSDFVKRNVQVGCAADVQQLFLDRVQRFFKLPENNRFRTTHYDNQSRQSAGVIDRKRNHKYPIVLTELEYRYICKEHPEFWAGDTGAHEHRAVGIYANKDLVKWSTLRFEQLVPTQLTEPKSDNMQIQNVQAIRFGRSAEAVEREGGLWAVWKPPIPPDDSVGVWDVLVYANVLTSQQVRTLLGGANDPMSLRFEKLHFGRCIHRWPSVRGGHDIQVDGMSTGLGLPTMSMSKNGKKFNIDKRPTVVSKFAPPIDGNVREEPTWLRGTCVQLSYHPVDTNNTTKIVRPANLTLPHVAVADYFRSIRRTRMAIRNNGTNERLVAIEMRSPRDIFDAIAFFQFFIRLHEPVEGHELHLQNATSCAMIYAEIIDRGSFRCMNGGRLVGRYRQAEDTAGYNKAITPFQSYIEHTLTGGTNNDGTSGVRRDAEDFIEGILIAFGIRVMILDVRDSRVYLSCHTHHRKWNDVVAISGSSPRPHPTMVIQRLPDGSMRVIAMRKGSKKALQIKMDFIDSEVAADIAARKKLLSRCDTLIATTESQDLLPPVGLWAPHPQVEHVRDALEGQGLRAVYQIIGRSGQCVGLLVGKKTNFNTMYTQNDGGLVHVPVAPCAPSVPTHTSGLLHVEYDADSHKFRFCYDPYWNVMKLDWVAPRLANHMVARKTIVAIQEQGDFAGLHIWYIHRNSLRLACNEFSFVLTNEQATEEVPEGGWGPGVEINKMLSFAKQMDRVTSTRGGTPTTLESGVSNLLSAESLLGNGIIRHIMNPDNKNVSHVLLKDNDTMVGVQASVSFLTPMEKGFMFEHAPGYRLKAHVQPRVVRRRRAPRTRGRNAPHVSYSALRMLLGNGRNAWNAQTHPLEYTNSSAPVKHLYRRSRPGEVDGMGGRLTDGSDAGQGEPNNNNDNSEGDDSSAVLPRLGKSKGRKVSLLGGIIVDTPPKGNIRIFRVEADDTARYIFVICDYFESKSLKNYLDSVGNVRDRVPIYNKRRGNAQKPIYRYARYTAGEDSPPVPVFMKNAVRRIWETASELVPSVGGMQMTGITDLRFEGCGSMKNGGSYCKICEDTPVTAFLSMGQTRVLRLVCDKDLKSKFKYSTGLRRKKTPRAEAMRYVSIIGKTPPINIPMPHNTLVIVADSLLSGSLFQHSINCLKAKTVRKGDHHQLRVSFQ